MFFMKSSKQQLMLDGFTSDEDFQEQQILIFDKRLSEQPPQLKKSNRKIKVPPASQIATKTYSLRPDMVNGWVPKISLSNPIPITYDSQIIDVIVKSLLQSNQASSPKVAYLGPRYENSYHIHKKNEYPFPYSHIKQQIANIKLRQFVGNNPKLRIQSTLTFDSLFQSGNLDCAIKVAEHEYDLFIQVDTNTRGHQQWYNFKIRGGKKDVVYNFNICNFQKSKSLYSRGMKPYILSRFRHQNCKCGWQQAGENLKYQPKSLRYNCLTDYHIDKYHCLTFEYKFMAEQDQVQIAYCIPYQYSKLLKFIDTLVRNSNQKNYSIAVTKLCSSLGNLDVPLITIAQGEFKERIPTQNMTSATSQSTRSFTFEDFNQQDISKKCIIISGRIHPGQSNGSYLMHGFLQFICGSSIAAKYLRKHVVFKIIPMLNPDGVVSGNYRTGLSGKDFNREFAHPDRSIFPQISALKDLVIQMKKQYHHNVLLFLDFHGHSVKKNIFTYGPQFSIMERNYYECKIFPKIVSQNTPMFRYHSCIFKISSQKQTTARAILLKKLDLPFCYTIEASNGCFYKHDQMKDILFTSQLWIEAGQKIGISLYNYTELLNAAQELKRQRRQIKKMFQIRKIKVDSQDRSQSKQKNKIITRTEVEELQYNKYEQFLSQIKNEQNKKNPSVKSDDTISEGNSDSEKQADDLSPEKISRLTQMIKNKKYEAKQLERQVYDFEFKDMMVSKLISQDVKQEKKSNASIKQKCKGQQSSPQKIRLSIKNKTLVAKQKNHPRQKSNQFFVAPHRQQMIVNSQRPSLKINNLSFLPFKEQAPITMIQNPIRKQINTKGQAFKAVQQIRRTFNVQRTQNCLSIARTTTVFFKFQRPSRSIDHCETKAKSTSRR